jgi:lipopolysaccharide export system ATP-binding protein
VQETLAITDKTYLMFEGGILKAGVPEELVEDEMVRRVYLGQILKRRNWSLNTTPAYKDGRDSM